MDTVANIANRIRGSDRKPADDAWLEKRNPHTGEVLCMVADSASADVDEALSAADAAFVDWSELTPVRRGQILGDVAAAMKRESGRIADCISVETGKPPRDAAGEVGAAIAQAEYFSGEGMRLFGRSLTSSMPGKYSHTIRQPHGIAALIVPANTPIANIAWKVFPALICGNTAVLKASEDAPETANLFADIASDAGLPAGVLNVIHGRGDRAGAALVEDDRVAVVSFTGSTAVGRWIASVAGKRLARVSLELGGKNPLVVCDDADIDQAVHWAVLSAFSNAGQRCASGSRLLVFESAYQEFREKLITAAKSLTLGVDGGSDLGPVINARQHARILAAIEQAEREGGTILCGGGAPRDPELAGGYYVQPTVIEGLSRSSELDRTEVFGPVATMSRVRDLREALEVANGSDYGLTAAIHTRSVDRAIWFAQRVRAGVANVNIGTFGSEPHMPFGGFGVSGNGTREPGVEALDVYSELKNISFLERPNLI